VCALNFIALDNIFVTTDYSANVQCSTVFKKCIVIDLKLSALMRWSPRNTRAHVPSSSQRDCSYANCGKEEGP